MSSELSYAHYLQNKPNGDLRSKLTKLPLDIRDLLCAQEKHLSSFLTRSSIKFYKTLENYFFFNLIFNKFICSRTEITLDY